MDMATQQSKSGLVLEPCPRCGGLGEVESLIEGVPMTCYACGGHKTMPAESSGPVWFYHPRPYGDSQYTSQRIASVVAEPDGRWRTTYYAPDGPQRHEFERREEAFGQLRGYKMTELAARMLDAWSKTPVWAEGLKRLAYSQYMNLFVGEPYASDAFYLRARNREVVGDLDALLVICREVHQEFCPDEELW